MQIYYTGKAASIVVCVSPLSALMMDQKAKYSAKGLSTDFVGGAQFDQSVSRRVLEGQVQVVFITPQSLIQNMAYREMLLSKR